MGLRKTCDRVAYDKQRLTVISIRKPSTFSVSPLNSPGASGFNFFFPSAFLAFFISVATSVCAAAAVARLAVAACRAGTNAAKVLERVWKLAASRVNAASSASDAMVVWVCKY